jgi:4-hydroxy-tetrahydrodipicolinate reductase
MRTRIIIVGAKGRMGQALVRLAGGNAELELVAALGRGDDFAAVLDRADVAIEFAQHAVTALVAQSAAERGKALVIGSTGHTDEERASIEAQAGRIPIVFAPNYSVGVNLLFHLTRIAARTLGADFDREVVEMHHRHKIDAPSGTGRRLGEILAQEAGGTYDELLVHGRKGDVGARPKRIVGMHALRGGDVVGDHTVHFAGDGERLELTHRATSRDTFAAGALRAAQWVAGKKPGLYSMQEVLGLG